MARNSSIGKDTWNVRNFPRLLNFFSSHAPKLFILYHIWISCYRYIHKLPTIARISIGNKLIKWLSATSSSLTKTSSLHWISSKIQCFLSYSKIQCFLMNRLILYNPVENNLPRNHSFLSCRIWEIKLFIFHGLWIIFKTFPFKIKWIWK